MRKLECKGSYCLSAVSRASGATSSVGSASDAPRPADSSSDKDDNSDLQEKTPGGMSRLLERIIHSK